MMFPVPILPPTFDVMTLPDEESILEVLRVLIFAVPRVADELVRLAIVPVFALITPVIIPEAVI